MIYMTKPDLALNNLQWLICHKNTPNQTKNDKIKNKKNCKVNSDWKGNNAFCLYRLLSSVVLTLSILSYSSDAKICNTVVNDLIVSQAFNTQTLA